MTSTSSLVVRPLESGDRDAVLEIYELGMRTGNATFETSSPTWDKWDEGHLEVARFVGCVDGKVVGWAALSAVSSRCVYAGVAETSIYLNPSHHGLGIGKRLLGTLIDASEAAGIWTLQAGIFPENEGSLALHRSLGFREVGRRERIGQHHGVWRDVILLERRSSTVGLPETPPTPTH